MALSPTRRARLEAGLTMHDLFMRWKIQPSRLSLIERGLIEASPDERDRIAKALKASVADLFPATEQPAGEPAGDATLQ